MGHPSERPWPATAFPKRAVGPELSRCPQSRRSVSTKRASRYILLDTTDRDFPQRTRIPSDVCRTLGSFARSVLWLPKTHLIQTIRIS